MNTLSRKFPVFKEKGFHKAFIVFTVSFFSLVKADALTKDEPFNQSTVLPSESQYSNYAEKSLYENEPLFLVIPQWHYYDVFGNKILDGYNLWALSKERNDVGTGMSNIALHPFLKKRLYNLVEAADLHDNGGILVMIGDKIQSEFTPFSLKQSLFAGARFDVFYKLNSVSFLTNRISNTGFYGMLNDESRPEPIADWITGVHAVRKFGEIAGIGGTYVNLHHDEHQFVSNQFYGVDSDTARKTPTGLSLYGLDANVKLNKLQAYGEYLRSQEFLDGKFKPKAGDVVALNGYYDIFDKWRCGGEFYTIGFRFQTSFSCSYHDPDDFFKDHGVGDVYGLEKYQYSLVEDNDDGDEYPENGKNKTDWFPQGDPDGTIPAKYDRDKNGVWDYEEDFLNYDADPPDSKILFDRNNNGIPDEMEDDGYPDYPYVPSYYLPGEKYRRYDDMDDAWEIKTVDSLTNNSVTHKGLTGLHLYSRYIILQNLEVTVGGIFDKSQEKTFQMVYENGIPIGEESAFEKALSLYFLTHYKKDISRDKYIMIDNFLRSIRDNLPNHTQDFTFDPSTEVRDYYLVPVTETLPFYQTVVDELDYRDVFADALRAEFTLFKNRGFNFTTAGKYEFQRHFPHLEYNYAEENISSLILVNKCHYIYPLPFFKHLPFLKDMFLIPRYKNVYDYKEYGPRSDSLDAKYRRNNMSNTASLVWEWKITEKSAVTTGGQFRRFDDFLNSTENYNQPSFSIQLTLKDRYGSYLLALTTAFTWYAYIYEHPGKPHNPLNNAHRVADNIHSHALSIKVYCAFL